MGAEKRLGRKVDPPTHTLVGLPEPAHEFRTKDSGHNRFLHALLQKQDPVRRRRFYDRASKVRPVAPPSPHDVRQISHGEEAKRRDPLFGALLILCRLPRPASPFLPPYIMRIGHYTPDIWAPGGVSSYIRRLGRAQKARGDDVYYLGMEPPERKPPSDLTPHYASDAPALFRWARGADLDVLHVHNPLEDRPPKGLPLLRTLHDHTANCPSGTRHLARTQQPCNRTSDPVTCTWGHLVDGCGSRRPKAIRRNFDRIRRERETLSTVTMHAVSDHLKDRMVADGYEGERIHVLHSPAPALQASIAPPPTSSTPRFLFLGRIVPEKGLAPLLRALTSVDTPIHLDVAGDGYQKSGMEALCERLGLDDRVTFHGWAGPDQVDGLMSQARAVVFPSIWNEPAGLISLEAAVAGRAIIASRAGGIPEYATEDYAILVPPGSTTALAAALTQLATDYDEAARLGRAGRRVVAERFSLDNFLSGLDAIYDTVRETSASLPVP